MQKVGRFLWIHRLLVGCAALLAVGSYFSLAALSRPSRVGLLQARPKSLDFGYVWEATDFQWPISIDNVSQEDVRIADFAKSCSCAKAEPQSIVIPAGGSATVTLTIDLAARLPNDESPQRDFEVVIVPIIDKQSERSHFVVRGKVRAAITLAPRNIDFEDSLTRGLQFAPQVAVATCHTPIDQLEVRADESIVHVVVDRTASPPAGFIFEVTPSDMLPDGPFRANIAIIPVTADGARLPATELRVQGVIMPDVRSVPSVIDFGVGSVGDVREETISLRAVSGRPFVPEWDPASSNNAVVEPIGADEHGTYRFTVRCALTASSDQTDTVVFRIHRSGEDSKLVTIPIAYFGVADGR